MPGHPTRAGRRPASALIVYDSLKPGLFRENLEMHSGGSEGDFGSRNKVSCSTVVDIARRLCDDDADRGRGTTPSVTLKGTIVNRNVIRQWAQER